MTESERVSWRQSRVRQAWAEYLHAITDAESAAAIYRDGTVPTPDGGLTYRKALMAERAALDVYMDAVRELTVATLQSKRPIG